MYDVDTSEEEEEMKMEEDYVVGKALQKRAKISAELKRELYGCAITGACCTPRWKVLQRGL